MSRNLKRGDTVRVIMQKWYTKYLSIPSNRNWEICYEIDELREKPGKRWYCTSHHAKVIYLIYKHSLQYKQINLLQKWETDRQTRWLQYSPNSNEWGCSRCNDRLITIGQARQSKSSESFIHNIIMNTYWLNLNLLVRQRRW